jgi:O-antigen/teichoic acid export membrane protein
MSVERAAKAGLWSGIDILLRQGVGFVVAIILARLLAPEDFGIVALLTFFSSLSIVVVQGGLSAAIIQRRETSAEEEGAVFWCNLAASAALALVLLAIAPAVADFYGYPVLAPLMAMAAAQVVFSALGAVQTALLTRSLNFRALAKAGVLASTLSGAFGVGAALAGAGVWALALQMASMAAINSASLWLLCPWRPVMHFRFQTIRSLFSFGFFLSISSILDVLYTQGFALVIGKLHGVRDLGFYNRANGTQVLPNSIITTLIGRIALPLFAERASDPEALRRGVRMANSQAMILNLPMMVGLALVSDLVIATLFGDKWLPAAPILSILAVGGVLLPLHIINLQLLLAQGRSDQYLGIEITKKVIAVGFVLVGSYFGITGLAWSQTIFSVLALLINAYPAGRTLGYGAAAQVWDLRDLVAATTVMAAAVWLLRPLIDLAPPAELVVLVAAGATAYLATGFALRLRTFAESLSVARALLRRSESSQSQ